MTLQNIPQREANASAPSPKVRAVAARVRVNADKRVGKKTPEWIVELAKTEKAAS